MWNTIIKKYKLKKETQILRCLTYDTDFQPGREDHGFKRWAKEDITAICTMIERGEMQSFQNVKDKFDLERTDYFRYLKKTSGKENLELR